MLLAMHPRRSRNVEGLSSIGCLLFADTSDPSVPTTDKMVDRIYAAALATWLSGRSVTFFDPSATPVSCIPCICGGITAFRINVLQVQ